MIDLKKSLNLAQKLALEAGKFLLATQSKIKIKKFKNEFDLDVATNADLGAEKIIINGIRKYYPDHAICSEERGQIESRSDYLWYIDPLDGTKEFIKNIPIYTVNISLEYKSKLLVGVSYNPNTNYLFASAKNFGTLLNGKTVRVSQEGNLNKAFIYGHLPNYKMSFKRTREIWKILAEITQKCNRLRTSSADINSLALVAMGACEASILLNEPDWGPKWWDEAAGILMVREAGGIVTDQEGNSIINRDLSKSLIASNGKIHKQLIDFINNSTCHSEH